eukprot:scaffold41098_cov54-Phaeocystis_antarctica.AAC.2
MTPLRIARTRANPETRSARKRRRGARRIATKLPSARRRRRAKTTSPSASARIGARRTRSRRPGVAAPTARKSARRPAVFAPSPALHHLRHHYPLDKQGWWGRGG